MIARILLASCAALSALPAAALLIRPDRDDSEYLELATHYPSAAALANGAGEAVLVAPSWALTTAQNAKSLKEGSSTISFGGRAHVVKKVIPHPTPRAGEPTDVALVRFARPVGNVTPVPIFRGRDEEGRTVIFVATGESGKIGAPEGERKRDGRARAAINTIDRVAPALLGLRVKPAEEASDLQGAPAAGDAGAPAYLKTADGTYVAGIHYASNGEWSFFSRLSTLVGWIDEATLQYERAEQEEFLGSTTQ